MAKRIVYLSNYVPEEVVDIVRFDSFEQAVRMENICSYALDFVSAVLYDESIDGAVIANSCDSLRPLRDLLLNRTRKFIHQVKHPLKLSREAVLFYAEEIKCYKKRYEHFFSVKIGKSEIKNRVILLKQKCDFLQKIYRDISSISYHAYITAVNNSLRAPLTQWKSELDIYYPPSRGSKRLFLFGPYLSDLGIIKRIEEAGGIIVGDNLTNSKRYFSNNHIPLGKKSRDVYEKIALRNLSKAPSPTFNHFRGIIEETLGEIKRAGAEGVLFLLRKSCEPYDFFYPLLKNELENHGLPTLRLQVGAEHGYTRNNELDNLIQAFLDMC